MPNIAGRSIKALNKRLAAMSAVPNQVRSGGRAFDHVATHRTGGLTAGSAPKAATQDVKRLLKRGTSGQDIRIVRWNDGEENVAWSVYAVKGGAQGPENPHGLIPSRL